MFGVQPRALRGRHTQVSSGHNQEIRWEMPKVQPETQLLNRRGKHLSQRRGKQKVDRARVDVFIDISGSAHGSKFCKRSAV